MLTNALGADWLPHGMGGNGMGGTVGRGHALHNWAITHSIHSFIHELHDHPAALSVYLHVYEWDEVVRWVDPASAGK